MKLFNFDKPKSLAQIRKELGHTCSIPGCNEPLTNMVGPGLLVIIKFVRPTEETIPKKTFKVCAWIVTATKQFSTKIIGVAQTLLKYYKGIL
jgi:hypothetical protein